MYLVFHIFSYRCYSTLAAQFKFGTLSNHSLPFHPNMTFAFIFAADLMKISAKDMALPEPDL
jgi:hypothetical protein